MEASKSTISMNPSLENILPHILLPISMILGLASPPFRGRGIFWSFLIAYLAYLTLIDEFPADQQLKYALSSSWLWYVVTIQKLLCSNPEKAFWRLDRRDAEATYMSFGFEKIRWAAALWLNPRGVGWNYQIKRLPPPKYSNDQRFRFIFGQVLNLLLHYLVADAAILYLSKFSFPEILDNMALKNYILIGIDSGILIYASWHIQWIVVSILGVATGLSQPKDWPPFFGKFSEVTTVGQFWGSFWQQVLHQSLLGYSHKLVDLLHIPSHSIWSYLVHIHIGFFISGVFHAITLICLSSYPTSNIIFRDIMLFFMAQVPIICIEQAALSFHAKHIVATTTMSSNPGWKWKARRILFRSLGHIWVVSWLLCSGWPFLDVYFRIGMASWKMPFSVLGQVLPAIKSGRFSLTVSSQQSAHFIDQLLT